MSTSLSVGPFATEPQMNAWVASNAPVLASARVIYLQGDLGAGKTSFARALLRALGYSGNVKSPTYTLVEIYALPSSTVYHFDLYRMADPEEFAYLGVDDYEAEHSLWLVEWPGQGEGFLPQPDLVLDIQLPDAGRLFEWRACSDLGRKLLKSLQV